MNDFSPNNEGGAAPLHVFSYHGIRANDNPHIPPFNIGIASFSKEDDIMADEDSSRPS